MRFLSVCSGIDVASLAWGPLGWSAALLSEIEPFPREVLRLRYGAEDARRTRAGTGPVLWGDFSALRMRHLRRLGIDPAMIDVLVGGTPCQAFSKAGLRGSLSDPRGGLTIAFLRLAHAIQSVRARAGLSGLTATWENVPGVLNTPDNAFGCFLAGLVGADDALRSPLERGRWPRAGMVSGPRGRAAWRVLDAQYFGLAQRRERVFLVAGLGDGADPAAVLFERAGVCGDLAPRGEAIAGSADGATCSPGLGSGCAGWAEGRGTAAQAFGGGQNCNPTDLSTAITAHPGGRYDLDTETFIVARTLRAQHNASHRADSDNYVPVAFDCKAGGDTGFAIGELSGTLRGEGHGGGHAAVAGSFGVRRLTPVECERLQGIPDHFTRIPWRGRPAEQCPDGLRYRAIGNAYPRPVLAWIGQRIQAQAGRPAPLFAAE